MAADLTLHYWKIPGRSSLAYLLLKASDVPFEYLDEDEMVAAACSPCAFHGPHCSFDERP